MMRSLMVLGALAVVGFMAGWFTINRDSGRTTIEINRDEIRSDARQAVDRGKEYWEQRRQQQAQAQQNGGVPLAPWDNQATYPQGQPANYTQNPPAPNDPWNTAPAAPWETAPAAYQNGNYAPAPPQTAPAWPQQATPTWPQTGDYSR